MGHGPQPPIPNPQSPIPNPQLDNYQINIYIFFNLKKINLKKLLFYLKDNEKKPIK
jgi:hypothetical protein